MRARRKNTGKKLRRAARYLAGTLLLGGLSVALDLRIGVRCFGVAREFSALALARALKRGCLFFAQRL